MTTIMRAKRDELIWAAGFFDGEGSIFFTSSSSGQAMMLKISITQKHSSVLYRFDSATGDLGSVNIHMSNSKEYFRYSVHNAKAKKVIIQLIPWLDTIKLRQTTEALKAWKRYSEE